MKKLVIISIICFFIFIPGIILYVYGRSLWFPIYLKLRGLRTVSEVQQKIEADVLKRLYQDFNQSGIQLPLNRLCIIGLKEEKKLEIWGMKDDTWIFIKEYPFTASSGTLGPKLKEGDRQIPEGIYRVESLNPNSRYHLSIKLDYPNAFDKAKGKMDGRIDLGGDIFIHGKAVTIGCIPIGDAGIEELFYLVNKTGKNNIIVIIAPYNMRNRKKKVDIDEIEWEEELYNKIKKKLSKFQKEI